jgi:hypothetical protein
MDATVTISVESDLDNIDKFLKKPNIEQLLLKVKDDLLRIFQEIRQLSNINESFPDNLDEQNIIESVQKFVTVYSRNTNVQKITGSDGVINKLTMLAMADTSGDSSTTGSTGQTGTTGSTGQTGTTGSTGQTGTTGSTGQTSTTGSTGQTGTTGSPDQTGTTGSTGQTSTTGSTGQTGTTGSPNPLGQTSTTGSTSPLDANATPLESLPQIIEEAQSVISGLDMYLIIMNDDALSETTKQDLLNGVVDQLKKDLKALNGMLAQAVKPPATPSTTKADKYKTVLDNIKPNLTTDEQNRLDAILAAQNGGKKKRRTKKYKGGAVEEPTLPIYPNDMNTSMIYNATGLVTDAKDPLVIGAGNAVELGNTHSAFSAGMNTSTLNMGLSSDIANTLVPNFNMAGGTKKHHSKKVADKTHLKKKTTKDADKPTKKTAKK